MVIWASGCANRRHSPGNGTLEPDPAPPHLARVAGRGEPNQAPSLGTAESLGDISGVERPKEGEAGLSRGSPVGPGLWSGISASPRPVLCGSRRLPIPPSCAHLQTPLVSVAEMQLSFELSENQNGSRRRDPLEVC